MPKTFTLNRNSENFIHLVRAVAAQAVVVGHAVSFFHVLPWLQPPNFFYIQNIGVVCFFFISGFVICFTCRRKNQAGNYTFGLFLFERSYRLLLVLAPVALLVLLVDRGFIHWFGAPFEYSSSLTIGNYLGNILFLQDYPALDLLPLLLSHQVEITMLGTGRPFWTLAIEFWLYLFFGYIFLSKRGGKIVKLLYFSLFLLSLPVVLVNSTGGKGNGLAWLWFYGVIAVYLVESVSSRLRHYWPLLLAGTLLLGGAWLIGRSNFSEYNFVAGILLCTALLAAITACQSMQLPLFSDGMIKVIRFFSHYSFTLYASHYTVLYWLEKYPSNELSSFSLLIIGVAVSNAVALTLAVFLEMKYQESRDSLLNMAMGWREKLAARRRRVANSDYP